MSTDRLAPGAANGRRVPDFFIVGEPKSGTTALYEMLRKHPQIHMPEIKEPLYLATDLRAKFKRRAMRSRPETLDDYLALFAGVSPELRAGEASALYLWSADAAVNIRTLKPDARIVAVFREPASFLRSLHLQMVQNHTETQKDLGKALALEDARRRGKRIPRDCPRPAALLYSDRVRYTEHLRRYHETFPAEQVKVLIYDDFRRDNEGAVRSVLRHLQVDDSVEIATTEANPTVRLRSRHLDTLVRDVSVGNRNPLSRGAKAAVKTLTTESMRRSALHAAHRGLVFGRPREADDELMAKVRDRFKDEVVELSEYIDRDLVTLWGYGSD